MLYERHLLRGNIFREDSSVFRFHDGLLYVTWDECEVSFGFVYPIHLYLATRQKIIFPWKKNYMYYSLAAKKLLLFILPWKYILKVIIHSIIVKNFNRILSKRWENVKFSVAYYTSIIYNSILHLYFLWKKFFPPYTPFVRHRYGFLKLQTSKATII